LEITGFSVIDTTSEEEAQGLLDIVHLRTYVVPATPVKEELRLVGFAMLPPVPLMIVQVPVPIVGEFPASVVLVPQIV
jgi:hypothetical protein